jgi:uncharacterized protein YecE (DUF72 family)
VKALHVGCSGFSYADWRGRFYPDGLPQRRWLEYYATRFDTVEINATFYRLPKRETVAQWTQQVPPGFRFAVKASRYLTHVRRLRDLGDGWARFRDRIEPLVEARMLGPILWQLPANFHRDEELLATALAELGGSTQLGEGRHAFEFRDVSWFTDSVRKLLRDHGVAVRRLRLSATPPREARTPWQLLGQRARCLGGDDPPLAGPG